MMILLYLIAHRRVNPQPTQNLGKGAASASSFRKTDALFLLLPYIYEVSLNCSPWSSQLMHDAWVFCPEKEAVAHHQHNNNRFEASNLRKPQK
jgi:hypothetical protein